jgi:hypothetical protein
MKMNKLVRNERLKLQATLFNNLGIAIFIAGFSFLHWSECRPGFGVRWDFSSSARLRVWVCTLSGCGH